MFVVEMVLRNGTKNVYPKQRNGSITFCEARNDMVPKEPELFKRKGRKALQTNISQAIETVACEDIVAT